MAITINIYYKGKNGSAAKFAEEMTASGLVDAIRGEEGNQRYEYFIPIGDAKIGDAKIGDAETVLLIDEWKDQRALDIHHASPMMGRIAQLREKYDLSMRVERYIPDTSDASADAGFIRK